ncbi:MAG: tRNA (adenosine(37)-N6)-dimethylallyltransferase MiaA [Chloroflexi bacterium]|nr:tRNA (adenosine(37)-N6)-dimethylallyltransferase MiaA [Chloroflexota bacterium]
MPDARPPQPRDPNLPLRPLIAVVGPTAVGKSVLALGLAARVAGEIVSADSRLLYRGLDIGTAKPTREERSAVPHHLVDVTEVDRPWSLAEYKEEALRAIAGIHTRGCVPLLVGGTGQYVRALLEGWVIPRTTPDPALRAELAARAECEGALTLHRDLQVRDPQAAASIDPRNVRRVMRALEVIYLTGHPFSAQRTRMRMGFRTLCLGLTMPREELYARADARIETMLAAGWVEEVRGLLSRGFSPDLPAFSALGYREIARHVQGQLSLEECRTEIRRATRRLVRHQANWFRASDPDVVWIAAGPQALETATGHAKRFLAMPR